MHRGTEKEKRWNNDWYERKAFWEGEMKEIENHKGDE